MVKKTDKKDKRDSKGRFKKGRQPGPGRPPGTIQDVLCKDGKARTVSVLLDDLLGAYAKMGGGKFLAKWATQNHRNLTKFIDILYKFAPMPTIESSVEVKPLVVTVKTLPKGDAVSAMEKTIRDLGDRLREQDMELLRLRSIFSSHNITYEEIEHEPIRDKELVKHDDDEDEQDHSDRRKD